MSPTCQNTVASLLNPTSTREVTGYFWEVFDCSGGGGRIVVTVFAAVDIGRCCCGEGSSGPTVGGTDAGGGQKETRGRGL